MAIVNFSEITKEHKYVGGKAFHLAMLSQQKFPVPSGIIVSHHLAKDDFNLVAKWWNEIGQPPLAVRSSANDEDGADYSFAGQNSSYLNIRTEEDLLIAINNCFESINKVSSKAYRDLFLKDSSTAGKMNVLIQQMVKPKFAGVYFSVDPRDLNQGDLIEYVVGLGESLVSGEVTPFSVKNGQTKKNHAQWTESFTEQVRKLGQDVKAYLGKDVDMEWAIDESPKLYLLQARPVTAKYEATNYSEIAKQELKSLKARFPENTAWDGQTFADWTGLPSELSFSIFKEAFAKDFAYGESLKRLGYSSFDDNKSKSQNTSVLDLVFGRAYINLARLKPLFFGPIPYKIVAQPSPHLAFDAKQITMQTILRTPFSVYKMIRVGWNLSSKRSSWLQECQKELIDFQQKMSRPLNPSLYSSWESEAILKRFAKETHVFAKYYLLWPFILTILLESTMHSLSAITESILGKEKADKTLKHWMAIGVHTSTYEMKRYYDRASEDPSKRAFFMARYGHRGAGELDLRNPRWIELGDKTFAKNTTSKKTSLPKAVDSDSVVEEINQLKSFKKTILLQEWKLLKSMLELREQWKMAILKPFAEIRFLSQELAKRSGLNEDFYFLSKEEIINSQVAIKKIEPELLSLIAERKKKNQAFKYYSLPLIVSLQKIEKIVAGEDIEDANDLHGEPISPGVVFGTICVIRNINAYDIAGLPSDAIIVAETTDPGWTPIFSKSKGIIVERGGVLSHSAIVAREMGIPAVSSVMNCVNKLKDGDKIYLDGNKGYISYETRA